MVDKAESRKEVITRIKNRTAEEGHVWSLTEKERFLVCDMGFLNDTIRGYMVYILQGLDFTRADILKVMDELTYAFEMKDARNAKEYYLDFFWNGGKG